MFTSATHITATLCVCVSVSSCLTGFAQEPVAIRSHSGFPMIVFVYVNTELSLHPLTSNVVDRPRRLWCLKLVSFSFAKLSDGSLCTPISSKQTVSETT